MIEKVCPGLGCGSGGASTDDTSDPKWTFSLCGFLCHNVCWWACMFAKKIAVTTIVTTIIFCVHVSQTHYITWAIGHAVFAPVVIVACLLLRRRAVQADDPMLKVIIFYAVVILINMILTLLAFGDYIYIITTLQYGQVSALEAFLMSMEVLSVIITIVALYITKRAYDYLTTVARGQ